MAFLHRAPLLEPFPLFLFLFPPLFSPLFPVCTSPLPQLTVCILAQGRIKWVNESSLTTLKLIACFCVSLHLNRMRAETTLFT